MYRGAGVAIVLFALGGRADAREWTVGGAGADFPLLSPAIAAAGPNDVIRVRGGVYREDLVVDKPIATRGEHGPVLFGTGVGSVVTIAANGCEVSGLTIEGSGTGQTNEMDAAIQVRSSSNRIVGNHMRRVFYGVVVVNGTRNDIAENVIEGLRDLPFGRRGDGIYLYRAPGNAVEHNRVSGERDAIYFQYASGGRATGNIVSDSRYGLHDMFSDDTTIAGNVFADSVVGANVMNSRRIRMLENRIQRNRGVPGIGLTLKDCDDSTIERNVILENARGLLLDGSSTNRFTANIFRANDTAVTLFSSAEGNAFSENRFDDNWSDVVLSGADSGTRWSIDGRGNSWSRYGGFDFDGDGIGDSGHSVVGVFERLEGSNPAVRIFLQSPAAAGLELAARLAGAPVDHAVDPHPIVPAGSRSNATVGWMIGAVAALGIIFRRGGWSCSR